ncbi:diaminopimelate dehydrogenase [Bowdeniella nasicola]|uniref:Meso-diaminopimelate D-dehydrogenase n=1 Tax=Bowdeniella nasicola TaxID=208480 RepID=A0A1H3VG00_9ACTO|nr:diaminopimelate dehydrogenase [Bowdeniella nasicola]SDZ73679.1 diaminopimelate dehydrogenase [Bowdeniella nasicola]
MTQQETIRVAIAGYGNLGRSVEAIVGAQRDMELVAIFSRRDSLETASRVIPAADAPAHADEIDVLFLCLGSATDIPEQAPGFAEHFTTVDTYDNHHLIPAHRAAMDAAARRGGRLAVVATGWDPGLFSLNRVLAGALFPAPQQHTFWGTGVSQGHSDAVRRIAGVRKAVQYTIPSGEAIEAAKRGEAAELRATDAHIRDVYVVADPGEEDRIEREIRTLPDYFVGYDTRVSFIDDAEFDARHTGMPHGGHVITSGDLNGSHSAVEFSLELGRNPDFTAACQVAYGRAAARLAAAGETGARTVLEIPPYLLSPTGLDDLVKGYV